VVPRDVIFKGVVALLDFAGRVAIVTGAGMGMGRAHALALSARGARVVVNDVVEVNARAVVEEIVAAGGAAVADFHDVRSSAADIVPTAIEHFGRLDVVVANAGIVKIGTFTDQSADDFSTVYDVSWSGTIDLARAAWPHLITSRSGRLILVSSSGILGNPGSSAYGAAKGAIWAFGNSAAFDGDDVGVQVSTILPTAWTPMTAASFDNPTITEAMRATMGVEHVASFVTFLAHQDTTLHGHAFQVGGGHASRIVVGGLPKFRATGDTAEGWADVAHDLDSRQGHIDVYGSTGEQFGAELIAATPELAPILVGMNPSEAKS
jgi:NAD(P)-dependent dehydrogenase (short-subunit alcohol dehydrogenase family)